MTTRPFFEVSTPDHDGSSDATDHLIVWVAAESSEVVDAAIKDTGCKNWGQVGCVHRDSDIDFHLPADADRLVRTLKGEKLSEKKITVVVGAYGTSDYGDSPSYAAFAVTRKFLDRLITLGEVCTTHGLSEARVTGYPDWGPGTIEDELRLQNGEMAILPGGSIWYTDYPKHGDYRIESRATTLDLLTEAFNTTSDGGVAFLSDDGEVRRMYEEDKESEDETEKAD